MQITIKTHQMQLNQETTLQMKRRIHFALGRFANAINRVSARLTDINGPKGGQDKQCLIIVKLRKGGEIVIQEKGTDCNAILNHCANRVSRAVDRELTTRWSAPIRKIRRAQNTEKFVSLKSEVRDSDKIEQGSRTVQFDDK